MNRREELEKLIAEKKAEAVRSGPIHRRDTERYVRRLERDLKEFDRLSGAARPVSRPSTGPQNF